MTRKSMKDRLAERLAEKQMTPEHLSAAQQAADNKMVQMVLWMPQRDRAWFNSRAALASKKTVSIQIREMLEERFGTPPADFHVPLDD